MSNSVSRSYSKNNEDASLRQEVIISPSLINAWSVRLAEQVPFCPCPPETAQPSLVAVDGGILFSLYSACSQCGFDILETHLIDGACYDCLYSDGDGEQQS